MCPRHEVRWILSFNITHSTEKLTYLCRLLETGEFSDFTIICGDQTWKAHKIILCRVDYFEKIITNGFKVCSLSYILRWLKTCDIMIRKVADGVDCIGIAGESDQHPEL